MAGTIAKRGGNYQEEEINLFSPTLTAPPDEKSTISGAFLENELANET